MEPVAVRGHQTIVVPTIVAARLISDVNNHMGNISIRS